MGQRASSKLSFSDEIELVTPPPTAPSNPRQSIKAISENVTVIEEAEYSPTNDAFTTFWLSTPRGQQRTMSDEAKAGIKDERQMNFTTGCRLYPIAFVWSVVISLTIVMEAYDKVLITSFFASPAFRRAFGQPSQSGKDTAEDKLYQISTAWQTSLTNGGVGGEIIGLLMHGFLTEKFGYRKTMLATLVWMCLAVFLAVFAHNVQTLLVSQVLCGIPWGVIQTLAATYAAEILPAALRPYLLGNINMCWLIGQLAGTCVVRGSIGLDGNLSFKLPFGLQWVWGVPLVIAVYFAPESPWWLIRQGRPHEARRSLERLTTEGLLDIDRTMALMIHTDKVERRLGDRSTTSYWACFQGTNRRRTEIACMVWSAQALCGATFIGYAAYFFEQAGFDIAYAFNLSVGTCGVAIVGSALAWVLVRQVGRRTLYLWGLCGCIFCLLGAGVISVVDPSLQELNWVTGGAVILLTFIYDLTIGPVCYVLVAEIPSTRMRLRTVILARVAYNIIIATSNIILPQMLNPSGWDWKGKSFFPFLGTAILCLVWSFRRLPETKGLAHLEMDILFQKKAPAAKFKQFQKGLEDSGYFSLTRVEKSSSVWHGTVGFA